MRYAVIDEDYTVHLYEDGVLVETRQVQGKSKYYIEDLIENWETFTPV